MNMLKTQQLNNLKSQEQLEKQDQIMEAYGRTLLRQPNEFERVQRGSSPLGRNTPDIKVPFQATSTEKKRKMKTIKEKQANKLVHATKNAEIGHQISPNRLKEPFSNQPLNIVQATEMKKTKKTGKLKKDDQENLSDPSRTPVLTGTHSISSTQGGLSAEKHP